MNEIKINGALLKDMFLAGAALLEKNKSVIDSLNVFPVPDGDTGTNMSMTMQSAAREIRSAGGTSVGDVAAAASLGALKGARGNSGVILSQIFRGFSKALSGAEEMDAAMLASALKNGTAAAYKAVMKPKEGTMLTVCRMIGDAVAEQAEAGANVYKLLDVMLESGETALKMTPDLLPVLKEAGVVDSGGKGLLTIFRGFKMALDGEEIDDVAIDDGVAAPDEDVLTLEDVNDIKFGYCTEFFITHLEEGFSEEELEKFREKLIRVGDSVVVAYDGGIVKVHVHSNAPGKILQLALRLGELDKLKVDNMRQQNRDMQEAIKKAEKESAFIAVSTGAGIASIFSELGAGGLIEGGQTMNPSIDTIDKAVRKANARNVFILPNNSNIILAAQQAAQLSERNVVVIPTKSVVQGIAAATAYLPDAEPEANTKAMTAAIGEVLSGEVTYAVRDTQVNGNKIREGDIIGLLDHQIVTVSDNVDAACLALLDQMIAQKGSDSVVSLYYGESMDEGNANALLAELEKKYPDAEFLVQPGGQPLYYYYFSVE